MALSNTDWGVIGGAGAVTGLASFFNRKSMAKQRDKAISMANAMYDPNQLNPMRDEARRLAMEGIDDASIRQAVAARTFASEPQRAASMYGGNATAYIAGQQAGDVQRQTALGFSELEIGAKEEEAKQLGRMKMSDILTQQNQLNAQRVGSIRGAEMQYEAAKQEQNMQLAATGLNLGLAALTGGASLPVTAALTPAVTGAITADQLAMKNDPSAQDMIAAMGGTPTTQTTGQVASDASVMKKPVIAPLEVPKVTEIPFTKRNKPSYVTPNNVPQPILEQQQFGFTNDWLNKRFNPATGRFE